MGTSSTTRRVDRGRDRILNDLKTRLVSKVGFPFENNPLHEAAHMRMAELAVQHEYGMASRNLPARPFMRATGKRERKRARILFKILHKQMLAGRITKQQMLARLGVWYAAEMRETITQHGILIFKPLKPSTIRRKGSSTPLLDTAGMKGAITSVVVAPGAVK